MARPSRWEVSKVWPLKPRGGRTVGDQGRDFEGQNRELTLACSLLVVTLQESLFHKRASRKPGERMSEVEQANRREIEAGPKSQGQCVTFRPVVL